MDGDDEPLADPGWLARLLNMREPPTPPLLRKTIYKEDPEDPLPDLFCNEVMPSTTSWPTTATESLGVGMRAGLAPERPWARRASRDAFLSDR